MRSSISNKPLKIQHVLLDLDGTLVDSSRGIYLAFVSACDEVDIQAPHFDEFFRYIGPPIQILAKQIYPDIHPDKLLALTTKFRSEYDYKYYSTVQWHDGVIKGLQRLATQPNILLSIVTNKPTNPATAIIKDAGIYDLFHVVVGIDHRRLAASGEVFANKAEALGYTLSLVGCSPSQAVYVGDTPSDFQACSRHDISFIAATYGFHRWIKTELQSLMIANSFDEVFALLSRVVLPIPSESQY